MIHGDQEESHPSTRGSINDYNDYKIGTLSPPPVIGSYTDNHDQIDCRQVLIVLWLFRQIY